MNKPFANKHIKLFNPESPSPSTQGTLEILDTIEHGLISIACFKV